MVHSDDEEEKVNSEWVDDVVARAVERSLENSPEFNPTDTDHLGQISSDEFSSPEPRKQTQDKDDDKLENVLTLEESPYPDDGFTQEAVDIEDNNQKGKPMKGFLEWGAVILGALLVAFLIKTFLMQAYYIPSSSMTPTLQVGDRVLVNKLSYKVGSIGRGDLIVFQRPSNEDTGQTDLIKRVIALEGELIEIVDGRIYITESESSTRQLLVEPYLSASTITHGFETTETCEIATETSCLIPDDYIFVLGDNRNGSRDSRFFGPISEDQVVGRAFIRLWPISSLKFL